MKKRKAKEADVERVLDRIDIDVLESSTSGWSEILRAINSL